VDRLFSALEHLNWLWGQPAFYPKVHFFIHLALKELSGLSQGKMLEAAKLAKFHVVLRL
jgi:hypothetical protein